MVEDKDISERVRLVEGDLALTSDFIKGVVAVSAALRGSAITLWVALLGFAFSQRVSELALLAVVIVVSFAIVDAYHGWLYAGAFRHARAIEKLLAEYYNALSRHRDEPDVATRFRGSLRAHRYGPYRSLPSRFRLSDLAAARPRLVYAVVYPALAVLALGVYIAFLTGAFDTEETPGHPPVEQCQCREGTSETPRTPADPAISPSP